MPRQQRSMQTSREGRLYLAISSYRTNQKQSLRALAAAYDVPESTLRTRLRRTQPRSETVSVNRKPSPFIILRGKVHQSNWYDELPLDWTIGVSDNGWTIDKLGVDWIKHFNQYTAARTAGVYRLLILDGHSSHVTPEFD